MPRQDLFGHPFEQGTLLKLNLLESYVESWVPTFASPGSKINIYDFFCGPGQDSNGILGSPLRIINTVLSHAPRLSSTNSQVRIYLFDQNEHHISCLKEELGKLTLPHWLSVDSRPLPFNQAFHQCIPAMLERGAANFVFLDPCGLLDDSEHSINVLSTIQRTDWLLFLPAQHICRFANTKEFINKFGEIDLDSLQSVKMAHISLCNHIRDHWLANKDGYYLVPFAIQKAAKRNINTLIFGSGHIRGLDKYLKVLWDKSDNGEANFHLEGDLPFTGQRPLLEELSKPNKISQFQNILREEVLSGTYRNNKDILIETLKRGFLPPKHAKPILTDLARKGLIEKITTLSYASIAKGKIQPVTLIK